MSIAFISAIEIEPLHPWTIGLEPLSLDSTMLTWTCRLFLLHLSAYDVCTVVEEYYVPLSLPRSCEICELRRLDRDDSNMMFGEASPQ